MARLTRSLASSAIFTSLRPRETTKLAGTKVSRSISLPYALLRKACLPPPYLPRAPTPAPSQRCARACCVPLSTVARDQPRVLCTIRECSASTGDRLTRSRISLTVLHGRRRSPSSIHQHRLNQAAMSPPSPQHRAMAPSFPAYDYTRRLGGS